MRVNYDLIAPTYDSGPFRGKEVDPHLLAFLAEREATAVAPRILDLGCGTGSQLAANQAHLTSGTSDHFLPLNVLQKLMADTGFVNIQLERNHFHYEQDLAQFLTLVQDRVAASQLVAISDIDYEAGLQCVMEDVNGRHILAFTSEICLITLRADKYE